MRIQRLLQGENVRLTPMTEEDAPFIVDWQYDTLFLRLIDSGPAIPTSVPQMIQWLQTVSASNRDFLFVIRPIDSNEILGMVQLDGILWNHGVSGISIGIGNPLHQNKGYGTEAMRLALQFAFEELNLHRVQLTVFSYNERAIKVYEKLGFQREGVFREFIHRDNQRHDMYLYSLLRSEWKRPEEKEK